MVPKLTSDQRQTRSWISISLWGLFSAIGWAGGLYFITPLTDAGLSTVGYVGVMLEFISGAVVGTLTGLLVGMGQSYVLRRYGFVYIGWARRTLIGLALGWGLGAGLSKPIARLFQLPNLELLLTAVGGTLIVALAGGVLGLYQYISLREVIHRPGWWVLFSLGSWAVGGFVYWIVYRAAGGPFAHEDLYPQLEPWPGDQTFYLARLLGWLAGGTIVGSFMAFGLNYIVKNYSALRKSLEN